MKTFKLAIATILFVGISQVSFAQGKAKDSNLKTEVKLEKEIPANQVYILDIKQMQLNFKDGKIPADCPKYNHEISKKENEKIIREWAAKHKSILTEEAIKKYQIK